MSWLRVRDLKDSTHMDLRVLDMLEFNVILGMD